MSVSRLFLLCLLLLIAVPARAQQDDTPMQRRATEASAERLLDDSLLSDRQKVERARLQLAEPLPQGDKGEVLGEALLSRGLAALQLGRPGQAIRDLSQAAQLTRGEDRQDALHSLSLALLNSGHLVRAIQVLREGNINESHPKAILRNLALIAEQYGKLGDVRGATETAAECETQALKMQGGSNPQGVIWRQTNLLRCRIAVLNAEGKLTEIEPLIRKVIAVYEEAPNTRDTYNVGNRYQNLAENLRAQGRLADAETEQRTALAIFQRTVGPDSQRTGSGLQNLGRIIAEQGRVAEGEALARKGLEVTQAAGGRGNGGARTILADILSLNYRWKEAREQFELTREAYADEPELFANLTRRDLNYALSLLKTGAAAEALSLFQRSYGDFSARLGDSAFVTAQARGLMGAALAQLGRTQEALDAFAAALPILVAGENDEDQETGNRAHDQKLRLTLEAYMDLLDKARDAARASGLDPVAESFRVADAARGRTVQRALAASATRAAARDPALADLARRLQDDEKRIAALGGLLANAISARAEDQDSKTQDGLKDQIADLRAEHAQLSKTITARFPEYGRLLNPRPFTVADIQAHLRPDEAMLAFYSAEDRIWVWAVPASGAASLVSVPLGRLELEDRVRHLRQALEPSVDEVTDFPAFDLAAAHRLYAELLQPSETLWGRAQTLFVVPHGPLGQLPLAVLPTAPPPPAVKGGAAPLFAEYRQVPWLARRAAIAQLPSVGAVVTLRSLPEHQGVRRSFVAFGDPVFSKDQAPVLAGGGIAVASRGIHRRAAPKSGADYSAELSQLPRLPDTAEEVTSIGKVLGADPDRDLFLQLRASEANVRKADLSQWRIVMFATHGLIPGDLAGLDQPALALSNPAVTGDGSAGLLTMERIMGLKLDADWVVLSACNTAAGDGSGAEAVSGLGRAFFYAGTRALLVSNWPVETVSARLLTTDLFRRQAQDPALRRAQALRQAMLGLMDGPGPTDDRGREAFSYAHPTFWAPFSLVGDGG